MLPPPVCAQLLLNGVTRPLRQPSLISQPLSSSMTALTVTVGASAFFFGVHGHGGSTCGAGVACGSWASCGAGAITIGSPAAAKAQASGSAASPFNQFLMLSRHPVGSIGVDPPWPGP